MKTRDFLILALLVILAILPVAYGFLYIHKYGVNIPLDDQWDTLVPWTIQVHEGTFSPLSLITSAQNDSRLFFPGLIMVAVSVATGMNIKAIFYIGYLVYVCCLLVIAWMFFREQKSQKTTCFLLFLPVFYYACNPYYLFRFIYNLGSMSALVILFALATIVLLDRSKEEGSIKKSYLFLGLSVLFAVMCSFSGAPGLTIWFAGLLQISLQDTGEKVRKSLIWIISAGLLFFTYYIGLGFRTETIHGTEGYSAFLVTAITYPLQKVYCFMGVLGAEVIHNADIAYLFGLLLTGIFLVLLYINRSSLRLDAYSKWYALMAFGTLTGLALALVRSGQVTITNFGSPETFLYIPALRHSLDMFLPMMCLYILALLYTRDSLDDPAGTDTGNSPAFYKMAGNLVILGMMLTLMVCGAMLHLFPGIAVAGQSHEKNINSEYYLSQYESASDASLKQMHPNPQTVRRYAPALEKYHLNVFSNRTKASVQIQLAMRTPDRIYDSDNKTLNPGYYTTSPDKRIQKISMPAVFEHPQGNASILAYGNLPIPHNASLSFYTGIDEGVYNRSASDGVLFEIIIADPATGTETTVFSRYLDPAHDPGDRSWQFQTIDLQRFGGGAVDLFLITRPRSNANYDWAWWGDPRITA